MKTSSVHFGSISGYRNAYFAARECGASAIRASISILAARLFYKLGPKFHSLFELWKVPSKNFASFISNNEANERHRLLSSGSSQEMTENKLQFAKFCEGCELPTVSVLCTIGLEFDACLEGVFNVSSLDSWLTCIQKFPCDVFIKPLDGKSGEGAFSATWQGEKWCFAGYEGKNEKLYEYCMQNLHGGLMVQPKLVAHPDVRSRLSPNALCTVRAITNLGSEGPELLFAVLRLPVGDNDTDNWSVGGATGNLVVAIDSESGVLGVARGSRRNDWPFMYSTEIHPDTGKRITGYKLPHWEEVRRLVLNAQGKLSVIPTLGWDVAITDSGPLLIETNWGYGVEIIQVALQRGIRDDLERVFRMCQSDSCG